MSDKASNGAQPHNDVSKALQELTKGEQTATMLESHLSRLEAKIDDLLKEASADSPGADQISEQTAEQAAGRSTGESGRQDGVQKQE